MEVAKFNKCKRYKIKIGFPHSRALTMETIAEMHDLPLDETREMMLEKEWQFARDYDFYGDPLFFPPNFDPPLTEDEIDALLTKKGTMPKLCVYQAWKEACEARGLKSDAHSYHYNSANFVAYRFDGRKVIEEPIGD